MSTAPLMNGSAAPRGSVVSLTDHAGGDCGEEEEGPSIHDPGHPVTSPDNLESHRHIEQMRMFVV